ncbi:MAG: hypothetical protein GEV07_14755 [Streptosporangiales bacterium]|nr:hypothetical protein [Streptosporangiales bacterium]
MSCGCAGPGRAASHLLLEYTDADGVPMPGQWFADPHRLRRTAARTPAPAEVVREAGVLLQPAGADRRLPGLRTLLQEPANTLVVHRPERRGVVRMATGTSYAKVVRPGRSAHLVDNLARADAAAAFAVPRVVDHDSAAGTVVCTTLDGRTLYDIGADPSWSTAAAWRTWRAVGDALRTLHDAPLDDALPEHGASREHDTTADWQHAAVRHGLLPPVDVDAALRELRAGAPGPLGLLHRDLHDKQLVRRPDGGIGLVDLDTLAVGECALDLANLLTHLELRVAAGRLAGATAAAARAGFLTGYRPDTATLTRIPAYTPTTTSGLRLPPPPHLTPAHLSPTVTAAVSAPATSAVTDTEPETA